MTTKREKAVRSRNQEVSRRSVEVGATISPRGSCKYSMKRRRPTHEAEERDTIAVQYTQIQSYAVLWQE